MAGMEDKKKTKTESIISATLLLVLLVALVGMGAWAMKIVSSHLKATSPSFARDKNTPIPVKIVQAESVPVSSSLVTQAVLVENQSLPVYPGFQAMIETVHVETGELVKKGQPLVSFYPELIKAKLDLAASMVEIAEDENTAARENDEKVQSLFRKNLVGHDELAKAALAAKQAKSALLTSEYELQTAKADYSQVTIVAPVGGVVTSVTAFANTPARTTTPLVTLSVTNPIYVEAKVAQRFYADLALGQAVDVSLDAFPEQTFAASILRIGSEVDEQSDALSVYARLDNPDLTLRPGMGGVASIQLLEQAQDPVRIPAIALLGSNGRNAFVFAVDENKTARLSEVTLSGYEQGYVGIRSGIEAGQRVVVVGQQALKDGDKVEVGDAL